MSAISPWPDDAQALLIDAATSGDRDRAMQSWTSFLALGRALGDEGTWSLIPTLYLNLAQRHGFTAFDRREELRVAWMRTTLGNRQRFKVLETVLPRLSARNIPIIVFKGRAILQLHYGDIGARPCLDVDILVPPERFREAGELLISLGWQPRDGTLDGAGKQWTHALAFVDGGGRAIDLHAYLMHANCWPGIDEPAWRRSHPFAVGDALARTLSDGDHLVQTCAHGLWEPTRAKVYWIADALRIIGCGGVDWPALVETVRARRLSIPLAAALGFMRERFGAAVPDDVMHEIQRMTNWADRLVARDTTRWQGTRRFLLYSQAHAGESPLRRVIGFTQAYSGVRNPILAVGRTLFGKAASGVRRRLGATKERSP